MATRGGRPSLVGMTGSGPVDLWPEGPRARPLQTVGDGAQWDAPFDQSDPVACGGAWRAHAHKEASVSVIWQHDPEFDDPAEFIGFSVEARDGQIGTIDDASWETDTDHLVVDTGPWIFGRKVLIPAGLIEAIDLDNHTVQVGLTRQQVKDSPAFDPDRHRNRSHDYWDPYDDYYGGLPPLT